MAVPASWRCLPRLCGALVASAILPPLAHAERDTAQLVYVCDASRSSARFMEASAKSDAEVSGAIKRGAIAERMDTNDLIKSDPLNAEGYRIRRGSSVIVRQCGAFTVSIAGGFLNSNPGGSEGTYVFPVVTITHGEAKPFPPITIGRCTAGLTRFSRTSPCPTHWATSATAYEGTGDATPVLRLEHEYEDFLEP